jgi:drug/metabolite transporter (DMT)-like permease
MTTATVALAARSRTDRSVAFAKRGLGLALLSGMAWGLSGLIMDQGIRRPPFLDSPLWLLAPLTAAALHDTLAALWSLLFTGATGRLREVGRSLASRPGRWVCLGALFGGPLGMGGYIVGLKYAGLAYVMPITSLYPALATILAVVFLKERVPPRVWAGLGLCIAGVIAISYAPPDRISSGDFSLGLLMAGLATIGWASEGVLSTKGMDLLDPKAALAIRELVSGAVYLLVILPLAGGWSVLGQALSSSSALVILTASGLGAGSYMLWYTAMNMTGVSRAMAMNITYALWGIAFSAMFTDVEITRSLVGGAVVITAGMLLVVGNPRDMANLRNVG